MKTKLLIFGITGDLSTKKLLPALEQIVSTGEFDDLSIIGVSRREIQTADLLADCGKYSLLGNRLMTITMDLSNLGDYSDLKSKVSLSDDEQLLVYLAVPPKVVAEIIDLMGEAGINGKNVKILFEKPFGTDLASAQEVSKRVSRYYDESQVYRIDHYLAKEMAQNIVTVRSKNSLFSQIWEKGLISSVAIVASETIDIEGRVGFYEQTGALRDLVQGHLLQLLALTLMDIPQDFDWDQLPDLRLSALNSLKPADPRAVFRGQYEGYRDEVGNQGSNVETFVSMQLESTLPKWYGVPIKIITGKALSKKATEIRIHIKKTHSEQSDCVVFRINPNEGIGIELFVKEPGYGNKLEMRRLEFNYQGDARLPDAYEQVIVDAISSRKSLFTSSEEVIQSWRVLKPIQDNWQDNTSDIKIYPKGIDIKEVLA